MLSIHPDALIRKQSYVSFSQNYDEWGHKIFKLSFQLKNAKKYANFRGFFMLLLKEMAATYIILLILFRKRTQCNHFYRFYIWKTYMRTRKSVKKQKVTLQTQNDVSMTYVIISFHCFQQKDNVLRIAMICKTLM